MSAARAQREGREDEALAAIRRLRRQFPKNPDFALDEITVLTALGELEAAVELGEAVLERREAGFGNYHLLLPGLAEAGLGEALLFEERWAEAEAVLSRGLAAEPSPESSPAVDETRTRTIAVQRSNSKTACATCPTSSRRSNTRAPRCRSAGQAAR